jgi:hypothetical protein
VDAKIIQRPLWTRRSSRCKEDNCVVVARYPSVVHVGDTKATGDILEISPRSWQAFLTGLRSRGLGAAR